MVASAETILEPKLHGKRRRASISSVSSVVKKSSSMNSETGIWSTLMHREAAEVNGGPTRLDDQQFGSSGDLSIDHCSLSIDGNVDWQAIETRTNGTANANVTSQTVWGAAYINAAVLQGTYSAGVIQPNSRIYFLQDANWDTTAIVGCNSTTGTWGVTQRYVYSPYGTITVLNADWSTPPTGTQPLVDNLYQGVTLDSVAGLYYARNRNYSPSLGRWINQDPAGYINGANTYQFVVGNPVGNVDPIGLYSAQTLAEIIWNETSGIYPQYNPTGQQNYTNYNAGSQAELNAAREQLGIIVSENPMHAGPAHPPGPKAPPWAQKEWRYTLAAAAKANKFLRGVPPGTKSGPMPQFFMWPSNNGKAPNPGHKGNPWPYQRQPSGVYGPFRIPVQVGDVPKGNNIYIFVYEK